MVKLRIIPSKNELLSSDYKQKIETLCHTIAQADAILIGAGLGLSESAGLSYTGKRFERLFADFISAYHFSDMYEASTFQYASPEEKWAFWSRYIWYNRYENPPKDTYDKLLELVHDKEYFVITSNVDHCFQEAGWNTNSLFNSQGDLGQWQCCVPCHKATYSNYETVKAMVEQQENRRVPSELVPVCPRCGNPMSMNLRSEDNFVEDTGWHAASARYTTFIEQHAEDKLVLFELGIGNTTPDIIKYPFWRIATENKQATYVCINKDESYIPQELAERSIAFQANIDQVFKDALKKRDAHV